MLNKEKIQLNTLKRALLLIALIFSFNTVFAQKALKILKDDGSLTYINASAVNTITFVTPLAIGDTYEGGIIFYLAASGEHGLVAAASDQSAGIHWYNGSYTTTGVTGDAVGAGEENTILIEISQGSGSYAAKLCRDLTLGGYTDWYLPSKYELNLMYQQIATIGGFASGQYWSSTEGSSFLAWAQNFSGGFQGSGDKGATAYVRAVRAF